MSSLRRRSSSLNFMFMMECALSAGLHTKRTGKPTSGGADARQRPRSFSRCRSESLAAVTFPPAPNARHVPYRVQALAANIVTGPHNRVFRKSFLHSADIPARIPGLRCALINGDASDLELMPQPREIARSKILKTKRERTEPIGVVQERKNIGQLDHIFVEKMLLDRSLAALLRDKFRPGKLPRRIASAQGDGTAQPSLGNAGREIAQALVSERDIGQPGLPDQRVAPVKQLQEFHGRVVGGDDVERFL